MYMAFLFSLCSVCKQISQSEEVRQAAQTNEPVGASNRQSMPLCSTVEVRNQSGFGNKYLPVFPLPCTDKGDFVSRNKLPNGKLVQSSDFMCAFP